MKPARVIVLRDVKPANVICVTVSRRTSTTERRRRLVHLLAVLLDKPDNPEEDEKPCTRQNP